MSESKKLQIRPPTMEQCGGNCFWISKGAHDKIVELNDPSAMAVYIGLTRLQNKFEGKTRRDWFFASASAIANVSGVGVTTVFRKIPLLVSKKLILHKSGKNKGQAGKIGKSHDASHFALVHWPYSREIEAPYSNGEEAPYVNEFSSDGSPRKTGRGSSTEKDPPSGSNVHSAYACTAPEGEAGELEL